MRIIPALDLRRGRVVHAAGGDRRGYAPLASRFPGLPEEPVALADRLRRRWGARPLYVADLDALEGGPPQAALLGGLAAAGHELWVDAGTRTAGRARELRRLGVARVIVGLETLPGGEAGREALGRVADAIGTGRTVFSLDLREGRPVRGPAGSDPAAIAAEAARRGAGHVLVLELGRVGARSGPATGPVEACRLGLPARVRVLAGGGVRDARDVEALARIGCAGCLTATALHGDELTPEDVRRLEGAGAAQSTGRTHRPD